jgi:hypothetical protein
MIKPSQIRSILLQHDTFWGDQRSEMRQLKALYMTRFWKTRGDSTALRVEMPRAYAMVESYLGSLYSKDPAVKVAPDLRSRGNPQVAQATANTYLRTVRKVLENATRLALIYPCAFVKLAPVASVDPLKRVTSAALSPWEVIVDATAAEWDQQRWVGHVYMVPRSDVIDRYGAAPGKLLGGSHISWLEQEGSAGASDTSSSEEWNQWVRVVELYDMRDDKLLVWSADYDSGDSMLFEGVEVHVGALAEEASAETDNADLDVEMQHEKTGIPYKTASGRPIVPIVPLIFSNDPDVPLRGYSLVARSKDQFCELNLMRSYQANGVRRMARQWLAAAGSLPDDAVLKIMEGVDGEIIEVELANGQRLEDLLHPVPQAPIPADIAMYGATVEQDIRDAGLMAPFTRGEVTKSTATEQNLLAAYTSAEIGRMARTRDEAITGIAHIYNIMLSVVLGDEAEPLSLPNPVGPTMLSADDLTGDFTYWAEDAGNTPLNDAAKQAQFSGLVTLLRDLGADNASILSELIRVFKLSPEFASTIMEKVAEQEEAAEAAVEAPPVADPGAIPLPEEAAVTDGEGLI